MDPKISDNSTFSPKSLSAEALFQGLKRLPQELYDVIYDLTFTLNHKGLRDLGMVIPGGQVTGTAVSNFEGLPRDGRMDDLRRAEPGTLFGAPDSLALLQVDKTSREKLAASYYSGAFLARSSFTAMTWLSSLSSEHRRMVQLLYVSGERQTAKARRYGLEDAYRVMFGKWGSIVDWIKRFENVDISAGSNYFEGKYGDSEDLPLMRCTGFLKQDPKTSCYSWQPASLPKFRGIGIINDKPVFGPPRPPELE